MKRWSACGCFLLRVSVSWYSGYGAATAVSTQAVAWRDTTRPGLPIWKWPLALDHDGRLTQDIRKWVLTSCQKFKNLRWHLVKFLSLQIRKQIWRDLWLAPGRAGRGHNDASGDWCIRVQAMLVNIVPFFKDMAPWKQATWHLWI